MGKNRKWFWISGLKGKKWDISLISAQVIGPSIAHGRSFLSKQGKVFHICIQVFLLCTHHVTLSIYCFTCSVQDREKNVFGKGQDPVFLHVSRLTERLQKKNCHCSNPTVLRINLASKRTSGTYIHSL